MNWRIRYSTHLMHRLKIRELPYELPKDILISASEHYYDTITCHSIAVGKSKHRSKEREFVVVYREKHPGKVIEIITIHPLKFKQKENRIKNRRWVRK